MSMSGTNQILSNLYSLDIYGLTPQICLLFCQLTRQCCYNCDIMGQCMQYMNEQACEVYASACDVTG